jgi:hypothetical protein
VAQNKQKILLQNKAGELVEIDIDLAKFAMAQALKTLNKSTKTPT